MKLKNDNYKRVRGGHSRLLQVRCRKCDALICLYQKDGPGNLRRIYIDRISEPEVFMVVKSLVCPTDHIL